MAQPLSMDLRSRLLAAVDGGLSCRATALRFGVASSTAILWEAQRRETGDFAPKPQGGDMRSRRVEERAADTLAIWEAQGHLACGTARGPGRCRSDCLHCLLASLLRAQGDDAQKKTGHAIEQDRPDILKQRRERFEGQIGLEPERLVFID